MPFPTTVSVLQAPGIPGDFASQNTRQSALSGPGGLVAGPAGVTVANFAWIASSPTDPDNAGTIVNSFGSGPVSGFVHREQQALITAFLAETSNLVPQGFGVNLLTTGDFFVKNTGANLATVGMKAYANLATGAVTFAATGSPTAGGTSTSSTIATVSSTFTGSISGSILTVTSAPSNTLYPGAIITVGAASGTQVISQISGAAGGIGTYAISIPEQSVASGTAFTATYGIVTIGGTVTTFFGVGETLTGSGVTAGTQITSLIPGTGGVGGAGTYVVSPAQVIGSATPINASAINVETKWIAMSAGAAGETIKISSYPLG